MNDNRTKVSPEAEKIVEIPDKKQKNLSIKSPKKSKKVSKRNPKEQQSRRCLADDWVKGEGLVAISGWKRRGLTDEEIEKNIGVAHSTFCAWKKKYKDLSNTLKRSRARADAQVENALFVAAIGHHEKVMKAVLVNGKPVIGEDGKPMYIETDFYVPPDPKAMIFYLTNRMPEDYKMNRDRFTEKNDTQGGGKVEVVIRHEGLTEMEQQAIENAKAMDAKAGNEADSEQGMEDGY